MHQKNFLISAGRIVRPCVKNGKLLYSDFHQSQKHSADGLRTLASRELDEVFNPLTYRNRNYNNEQRNYLYALGAARARGMIVYSVYGKDMPDLIKYNEYIIRSGIIQHRIHIPQKIKKQILEKNSLKRIDHHFIFVDEGGFEVHAAASGKHLAEINDGYATIALTVKSDSGWHAVHPDIGLPYDDGLPHGGHSGNDRFLWKFNNYELRGLDSNGYFGSPIHVYYSPKFYGQDLVLSFGPSVPFLLWELVQ